MRSKGVVQRAEEFAEAAKANSPTLGELKTGPKPIYTVPKEEVAKAIGVSKGTLGNAEKHVAAVDEFPDLADEPQVLVRQSKTIPEKADNASVHR